MKPSNTKLTESQVREMREMRANGYLIRAIATHFGVGQTSVWDITSGRRWKNVEMVQRPKQDTGKAVSAMIAAREAKQQATDLAEKQKARDAERSQRIHARDPDVKVYREEKTGFERRTARKIEEAKALFLELMANRPRGGRPRKVQRSWEL